MDTDNGEGELAREVTDLPLNVLFIGTRKKIALYLDNKFDILHPEKGVLIDFRGVAECVGFCQLDIKSFERQRSPTLELLSKWDCTLEVKPTIGNFWSILKSLDRYDILEDCKINVESNGRSHLEKQRRFEEDFITRQDDTVSSSADHHYVNETEILTIHDVENPGPKVIYDAFVSYNESSAKDNEFVRECSRHLESEYGLKLLVPPRDLLVGGAKHLMNAELIKSRCKRMLIVLSHDYIKSVDTDFQLKFAQTLSPDSRQQRLIPVLTDHSVLIPDILRCITVCDYTKEDLRDWFWSRLADTLKAPMTS